MCVSFWQKATELGLPQQAAEKTHHGGRDDSGQVHGVGSLVHQPEEEEGQQRTQGDEFVPSMLYNVWADLVICMYVCTYTTYCT